MDALVDFGRPRGRGGGRGGYLIRGHTGTEETRDTAQQISTICRAAERRRITPLTRLDVCAARPGNGEVDRNSGRPDDVGSSRIGYLVHTRAGSHEDGLATPTTCTIARRGTFAELW